MSHQPPDRPHLGVAECPVCGHDVDDHAGGHGDTFDPCLLPDCDCQGPDPEPIMMHCFGSGYVCGTGGLCPYCGRPETVGAVIADHDCEDILAMLDRMHSDG